MFTAVSAVPRPVRPGVAGTDARSRVSMYVLHMTECPALPPDSRAVAAGIPVLAAACAAGPSRLAGAVAPPECELRSRPGVGRRPRRLCARNDSDGRRSCPDHARRAERVSPPVRDPAAAWIARVHVARASQEAGHPSRADGPGASRSGRGRRSGMERPFAREDLIASWRRRALRRRRRLGGGVGARGAPRLRAATGRLCRGMDDRTLRIDSRPPRRCSAGVARRSRRSPCTGRDRGIVARGHGTLAPPPGCAPRPGTDSTGASVDRMRRLAGGLDARRPTAGASLPRGLGAGSARAPRCRGASLVTDDPAVLAYAATLPVGPGPAAALGPHLRPSVGERDGGSEAAGAERALRGALARDAVRAEARPSESRGGRDRDRDRARRARTSPPLSHRVRCSRILPVARHFAGAAARIVYPRDDPDGTGSRRTARRARRRAAGSQPARLGDAPASGCGGAAG